MSLRALGQSTVYPTSVFNNQQLPNWRKGLMRALSGAGQAKIAFIGDSLTNGQQGNGTLLLSQAASSVLMNLVNNGLPAASPLCQNDVFGGSHSPSINTSALYNAYDPKLTFGTNLAFTPGVFSCIGCAPIDPAVSGSAAANTVVYTPTGSWDTYDLYTCQYSGAGNAITTNVNGGANLATITCNQAPTSVAKTTVAAGAHHAASSGVPINIILPTANSVLLGIHAYDSTAPRIHMLNFGWGSSCAGLPGDGSGGGGDVWNNNSWPWAPGWVSGSAYPGQPSALSHWSPDLTIIFLGVNDAIFANTIAAYTAGLQTQVSAAQSANSDVILVIPYSVTNVTDAFFAPYWNAAISVAQQNSLPYIDVKPNWGQPYTTAQTNGYLGADGLHPLSQGNYDIASVYYRELFQWV